MNNLLSKRNLAILKFLVVLGLVIYVLSISLPIFNEKPSNIVLSATLIGFIGFSIALFKLGKEIRVESLKDKTRTVKNSRDKLITFLNVLGVILVIFMFCANRFELIPKDTFVYVYVFAVIVFLAIILLTALKKREK